MRQLITAISLLLPALVTGCQTTGDAGAGVPLIPADTRIAAPSTDVPEEYAAFSGLYRGLWGLTESRLAVLSVEKDGDVSAIYAWGDHPDGRFSRGRVRRPGQIEDGVLTIHLMRSGHGAIVKFEKRYDGALAATWDKVGQEFNTVFYPVDSGE